MGLEIDLCHSIVRYDEKHLNFKQNIFLDSQHDIRINFRQSDCKNFDLSLISTHRQSNHSKENSDKIPNSFGEISQKLIGITQTHTG